MTDPLATPDPGGAHPLPPGTLLAGRFAIDGPPLGAGASGVVYPATDRATGRQVAAKVLHAVLLEDPSALEPLQDEVATAGRLRHPHVVEVFGLWSDRVEGEGRRWVMVSERVPGVALDQIGAVTPEAVVEMGLELVGALEAARRVGLVHGDVRPGNVLVGSKGAALFDFGVARIGASALLRPGETAPERLDGGPPSPASDVYGLGVVLHQALHGRLPFGGETPWATLGAQRVLPEIEGPRGLAGLIRQMLHPDPVERPDLLVVRAALQRLRRRPDRRVGRLRELPALRPGAPWAVHGVDPATGAPAFIRGGMSKRQARALLARLRTEGWQVRGVREAFGWGDLAWISAFTLLGGVVLPVVGALPAALVATRWRAEGIRPSLRTVLPPVAARVPPRVLAAGAEVAVAVGLLLLLTAVLLLWWPALALVPALLALSIVLLSVRPPRAAPEEVARQGRVIAALGQLRSMLDPAGIEAGGADAMLALAGEVDALESEWRAGALDDGGVLLRVEHLMTRAETAPRERDPVPAAALDALRRVREP